MSIKILLFGILFISIIIIGYYYLIIKPKNKANEIKENEVNENISNIPRTFNQKSVLNFNTPVYLAGNQYTSTN